VAETDTAPKTKPLFVELDAEDRQQLDELSELEKLTKADVVRRLIRAEHRRATRARNTAA